MELLTGLGALGAFLTSLVYGILKPLKVAGKQLYTKKVHYILGITTAILAGIHVGLSLKVLRFSFGTATLGLLIALILTGIILKRRPMTKNKIAIHATLGIACAICLLLHMSEQFLYMLF